MSAVLSSVMRTIARPFSAVREVFADIRAGMNRLDPAHDSRHNAFHSFDYSVMYAVLFLMSLGIVMVYSASAGLGQGNINLSFVTKQAAYFGAGILLCTILFQIPLDIWQKAAGLLFLGSVVLLILVLIPKVGTELGGAKRWLNLGVFMLQPAELTKLGVILYIADYCARRQENLTTSIKGTIPMVLVIALLGVCLMYQPDFGSLMVLSMIIFLVMFVAGMTLTSLFTLGSGLLITYGLIMWFSPWRMKRFFAYLDPFSDDNFYGTGYQLSQALIAFSIGKWTGTGLGQSMEKQFYLSEAHTDFILSIIGEELGLIGVTCVILAYVWLIWRGHIIGRQALKLNQVFNGFLAHAVVLWLCVQTVFHMGVNLGVLPTKGLTLPFVSYGGSAALMSCVAVMLLLRVDFESRQLMRGQRR